MREIPLTQGKVALVDDADFGLVASFSWYAQRSKDGHRFYALARDWQDWKKPRVRMHRLILGAPVGMDVDHEDGNGLNNVRYNIRVCTRAQNMRAHRHISPELSSIYRGVTWDKNRNKWRAQLQLVPGKGGYIGLFESEMEAAEAYNATAVAHDPKFQFINKI